MLHKDSIVQLTRDISLRRGVLIPRGSTGRVLSKIVLHRACMVEFTIDRRTVVARIDHHDMVEVLPNARV